MGHDVRISNATHRTERNHQILSALVKDVAGNGGKSNERALDHVSLSALTKALQSPETPGRLEDLHRDVSRGAYLVPAPELSRAIVADHLLPA